MQQRVERRTIDRSADESKERRREAGMSCFLVASCAACIRKGRRQSLSTLFSVNCSRSFFTQPALFRVTHDTRTH